MNRRESLRLMLMAAVGARHLLRPSGIRGQEIGFASQWQSWPDMRWAGPEYWGNRLQDWGVEGGIVTCRVRGPNRTLHCLTHQVASPSFVTEVHCDLRALAEGGAEALGGFRVGVKGRFDDPRSAAVHGTGVDVGIGGDGRIRIGETRSPRGIDPSQPVRLRLEVTWREGRAQTTLTVFSAENGATLAQLDDGRLGFEDVVGNVALLSHAPDQGARDGAAFSHWTISGDGVQADLTRTFGPIMFAQYTIHGDVLKLTAQLAPVDDIPGLRPRLETRAEGGRWIERSTASIDALSRTARFRVDPWEGDEVEYRVRLEVPTATGVVDFVYHGTIAAEPHATERLRAAVFSCNADHGFPDGEVVRNVLVQRPDLCLFLGDQFYESSGGFGIETDSVEEAALDMLHKWYMFGWSYRDLFRHVPAAFIPDDHDVYHGNIWGESGKVAPTDEGWGAVAQDQGGYKMPARWVNAVQMAQTSHLPDAYDPTPVEQGIGVYYTRWDYGGVSFAILEDRKFKSAPLNVLPAEARVGNGMIQNPDFDIRMHRDLPGASLLGERQMSFLRDWAADWSGSSFMKVVLSQTNFAAVHTIPSDHDSPAGAPSFPIPQPGEYVEGDKLIVDMDTNGWPQGKRDEVLGILRTCAAFHIAGDQHLATVVRHGIDRFGDAGFTFTGPALNNLWPRRWWPPVEARERALDSGPPYSGDYFDAFGNRVTVYAAANPQATGLEPAILRDRSTGYGIVTFDTLAERIEIECWPRHTDPALGDAGQYSDWPIVIRREQGDGRTPLAHVPVEVEGLPNAVVELRMAGGELVLARRLSQSSFAMPVFGFAEYVVRAGDPDRERWQERPIRVATADPEPIRFSFR